MMSLCFRERRKTGRETENGKRVKKNGEDEKSKRERTGRE